MTSMAYDSRGAPVAFVIASFAAVAGCAGGASDHVGTVDSTPTLDSNADSDTADPPATDADGDGFSISDGDCVDDDESVYPGALEVEGDGVDSNCNGSDLGELSLAGARSTIGVKPSEALRFGDAIAAGDLDGDGNSELVIGSLELLDGGTLPGLATVVSGAELDVVASWDGDDLSVEGSAGAMLGQAVAVGDVVLPAGLDVVVASGRAVYVAAGGSLPLSLDDAASIILEEGVIVLSVEMAVGNVTADTMPDLSLSVFDTSNERTDVCSFAGPLEPSLTVTSCDSIIEGVEMDAGVFPDAFGDGTSVFLIGSSTGGTAGVAYSFDTPLAGNVSLDEAAAVILGANDGDWFGSRMTIAPDASGEEQVLVGSMAWPNGDRLGKVDLFASSTLAALSSETRIGSVSSSSIEGVEPFFHFGESLSAADFDGDDVTDLAVGSTSWAPSDFGWVFLFYGPIEGTLAAVDADLIWAGERAGDWAGGALAADDFDGDDISDLVVGAAGVDVEALPNSGRVYLLTDVGAL